jgi:GTP-binding protein Era
VKKTHKSSFINIIGKPNVGKSSLVNYFMGRKISIISPKAQTTRHRIFSILNDDHYQLVFSDLPGIITPKNKLHKSMMKFVSGSYSDADVILLVIDSSKDDYFDNDLIDKIKSLKIPILIVLNKIDLIDNIILDQIVEKFSSIFKSEFIFPISITNTFNLDNLLDKIIELSPEGNPYFSKDQITDKSERFFVNEIIREKILNHYDKEIPYSVEVETTSFKHSSKIIKIESQIYVERSSQKGILIGHKGNNLKIIGTKARTDLEQFFQKKVFIDLKVKVLKNWKSEDKHLKRFGYDLG